MGVATMMRMLMAAAGVAALPALRTFLSRLQSVAVSTMSTMQLIKHALKGTCKCEMRSLRRLAEAPTCRSTVAANGRRRRQRAQKKGSASAPVSPVSVANTASARVTSKSQRARSGEDASLALGLVSESASDCIVLHSDTDSEFAPAHQSAPVSPVGLCSTSATGLARLQKREFAALQQFGPDPVLDQLTSSRSLFAGKARAVLSQVPNISSPPRAPVLQTLPQLSACAANISTQSWSSPDMCSPSPLPLRERLHQRGNTVLRSCEAACVIPNATGGQYCSQHACRDFAEPVPLPGGGGWLLQDLQPGTQAATGLEAQRFLDTHSSSDIISLVTP